MLIDQLSDLAQRDGIDKVCIARGPHNECDGAWFVWVFGRCDADDGVLTFDGTAPIAFEVIDDAAATIQAAGYDGTVTVVWDEEPADTTTH